MSVIPPDGNITIVAHGVRVIVTPGWRGSLVDSPSGAPARFAGVGIRVEPVNDSDFSAPHIESHPDSQVWHSGDVTFDCEVRP